MKRSAEKCVERYLQWREQIKNMPIADRMTAVIMRYPHGVKVETVAEYAEVPINRARRFILRLAADGEIVAHTLKNDGEKMTFWRAKEHAMATA